MKKAIVATKVGMTQIFNEDGVLTPVTVLQAGPVYVSQIKTVENDGYEAVQVAYGDVREKLVNKQVKVSRAQSSVMDSLADQWVTVPNSIDMLVPTVRHPIRVKYSKVRKCLVRWVQYRLPFRILRLSA